MFDKVQAVLDRRTISYGFDLIDADQQILHPERGAAPDVTSSRPKQESLELLLDTICNTFGGVLFIAIPL